MPGLLRLVSYEMRKWEPRAVNGAGDMQSFRMGLGDCKIPNGTL